MKDIIIGCHVSFRKDEQLLGSLNEALSYGANAFMFYTGAPQNTKRAPIDIDLKNKAFEKMKETGFNQENIIIHAPYIINLANNEKNFEFAIDFLKQELKRCEELGIYKIVLHPGSYVKLGGEVGTQNIINGLNEVLKEDTKVMILLETMAGKGTEVGRTFEEIKAIIDGVKHNKNIGVCMDTCHINDAGYDVSDFNTVLDKFDSIIGLDKLGCIHVNDSKNILGASKDRHENFGLGHIGFDSLINVIYDERIKNVPKILETPYVSENDEETKRLYPPYKFEIEMIRSEKNNDNLLEDIRNFYK